MDWIKYALIYLGGSFVASALVVRIWPKSWIATQIRQRLILFPVLPLLLIIYIAARMSTTTRRAMLIPRRLFELLSGQSLQARKGTFYGYGKPPKKKKKKAAEDTDPSI